MSALFVTSCAVQRSTSHEVSRFKIQDSKEVTARDSVSVEVTDSVVETKTITITKNEAGDTIMQSIITERDRVKNRDRVRDNHERTVIRTDTVFIEKRDSVYVNTRSTLVASHAKNLANPTNGKSGGLVSALRWIFWIIVALAGLVIIIKIRR
jgi:hypothetical protein